MDPHQRLDNASDSNLGNVSKISGASGTSQGNKARARLLSKMNKLVGPTASIFKHSASPRSTTTISAPTPADPFQITHERDEIPAYIPARPKQPRTSSECQEALEEMFAHARGQDSPQLAEPTSAKSVKKRPVEQRVPNRRPPPPLPPLPAPSHGIVPPRSVPTAAVPSSLKIPQDPRTASLGPRLETIPASPLSPATMRSMPTPSLPRFPLSPATPRTTNRRGIQRVMSEEGLRAPRPLSERAMIPLDPAKSLVRQQHGDYAQSPLSPLSVSALNASDSTARQNEKSPLARSPLRGDSPPARPATASARPPFSKGIAEMMKTPPVTKTWPRSRADAFHGEQPPRWKLSVDNLRAQNGEDRDIDYEPDSVAPSPRMVLESQNRRKENGRSGSGSGNETPSRMRTREWDLESSDSSYESINVRTPDLSLSPRKTKPTSIPATPARASRRRSNTTCDTPRTPRTPPPGHGRTAASSSSKRQGTPPLGWSRISPSQQHQQQQQQQQRHHHPRRKSSDMSSLSVSPTPHFAQRLKVFPSPPLHQVSIVASPTSPSLLRNRSWADSERGSALWHLERDMTYDKTWQPLTPRATPERSDHATEMIRVGSVQSGEGRRVVHVRDSNAENADTMKMLADENLEPRVLEQEERRHEAGGSYGDWFSYYAEEEGREAPSSGYVDDNPDPSSTGSPLSCGLFCSLPSRERDSSASSIYDRIQSIYDVYAELPEEGEEEQHDGMI